MFEQFAETSRPKSSRAQILYAAFFGTGILLRWVCLLGQPAHTHHGPWLWLNYLGLALMATGLCFNFREYFAGRAARRVKQPDAATR